MGLNLLFPKDFANYGRSVKAAHDSAMALARELIGGDPEKQDLLHAYDRGFYAALVAGQAAVGNCPVIGSGYSADDLKRVTKALPASSSIPLDEIVVGFLVAE